MISAWLCRLSPLRSSVNMTTSVSTDLQSAHNEAFMNVAFDPAMPGRSTGLQLS